jgi:hypothetical protein
MGGALDWFSFWGEAAAAAIGAAAAFGFTLWQARLQTAEERRARQLERRDIDLLTLKSAIDAAGQNLEELINLKSQMLVSLAAEAEALAAVLQTGNQKEIEATASRLPNFFQELPRGSFATIPASDRFAFAIDDAPAITKFVHRASSVPGSFSDAVDVRNALVRRWADVDRGGANGRDVMYFFTMLISAARAIVSHADDAIFFSTLLHDQCYFLGTEKFERPSFRSIRMRADKAQYLVSDDYVTGYRSQLVAFGRTLPVRTQQLTADPLTPPPPAAVPASSAKSTPRPPQH